MSRVKNWLIAGLVVVCIAAAGSSISRTSGSASPDLRLVLNIPASRLDVFENGVRTRSFDVSAGRREFATPRGNYRITRVTWNPWWHPPDSHWARHDKPTPPGPENPMGRVKINFAHLLYIHGTPYEDDLGAPASHGCIRMSNADLFQLARIVHKYRTPRVPAKVFASLQQNHSMTRSFDVKPVPFDVVYRLAEVVDGKLIIHPDVYRKAGMSVRTDVVAALKREGIKVTSHVEQRIGAVSKRRIAVRLTVALDSLIGEPDGD
jgi:murein L,D-transpeptidase YcbB/YkuD